MSEHESKLGETWEDLWKRDSESLKAAGVTAPKDRKCARLATSWGFPDSEHRLTRPPAIHVRLRYLLRQMQYYRCGRTVKEIPAKPKKEFRG